ncbi:ATP-dependent exonuclase V beta subunit, helicase and exonuclease domain-containing [Sphaerochaeta pleomorpha str. Grapes]|uniref:DNA 3'-5' helicase n=1 Tax=Sphaerochaeta pleomorpha (strain ATCC BAA-1885 / DSM 22778 / Grapes) TaxID=158190 RepID=G8QUM7_SPHPG|nr:UvrD-helicase domain-containing protein [Sphaerochaeta pleomorpha]AEV30335.1 ATP-dependent exonuclase V beta subunit, helicase and exonuclease domain-containing [Sphaerochaeta pleomorpha str. Grapes]
MITFEEVLAKTKRKLDENQLQAVNCDTNCVVSAGAGSGKTTVLSYRFLRLVLEKKADCDQILTLTFTRKAAKEMHERIHAQLLQFKSDPYVATQLSKFPDAEIATLDSFCSKIVRCDCTRYGIASDFSIDDEANKKNAQLCAQALMEENTFGEGARILAQIYNPEQLIDEVLVPLATQHYYLPKILDPGIVQPILDAVKTKYKEILDSFYQLLLSYEGFTASSKAVQSAREAASILLPAFDASDDYGVMLSLLGSSNYFWTKPGKGSGDDIDLLRETSDSYKAMRKQLCLALSILTHGQSLASVLAFLCEYQKAYQREKRKTGILTFSDVSSLAVDILKVNPSLRSYFKNKFRYIMIDEFQDNNQLQKDLLYLLSEKEELCNGGIPSYQDLQKDKLFFVGDEKQSIYRFRGSDVSVFKQLSSELKQNGGVALSLSTNYRSEPELIALFNSLFPVVMENHGESYEADFAELGSRAKKDAIEASCTLCIKPFDSADQDEGEDELAVGVDSEASAVALLMEKMLHTDEYLIPSETGPRRPEPKDIALLMRSTSSQLSFEKALRRYGIPYTLQTARSLMLEAPSNDLYNLLQLTIYPEDRLAYLGTLRSPFCNISDAGIVSILESYEENPLPFGTNPVLSDDDASRFEHASHFFSQLKDYVKTKTLSELVMHLWYESGYRLSLVTHAETQVYLEHYSFLHRLAQIKEKQGFGLSQFLDFIRENLGQNERLDDLDVIKEQSDGVQIMSIHKSKGLEFPIVFVASAGTKLMNKGSSLFAIQDTVIPYFMKNSFHETEKKICVTRGLKDFFDSGEEKLREKAELKRLLYVAFTRAETHLVVSGCFNRMNRNKNGDDSADNLLLLACNGLGLDIDSLAGKNTFVQVKRIEDVSEKSLYARKSESPASEDEGFEQKSDWYRQPLEEVDLLPSRYGVTTIFGVSEEAGNEALRLPLLDCDALFLKIVEQEKKKNPMQKDPYSPAADFGTLVHALCESRLLGENLPDERQLIPIPLARRLDEREKKQVLADASSLCDNFFACDLYRRFVQDTSFKCEVKFFSVVEYQGREVVAEGAIDLLVETPNEMLVIDFKTDLYKKAEVHARQVLTYLQAVERLYGKPARGCVTFLRQCGNEVWWKTNIDEK